MRKTAHILFATIFTVVTLGFTINKHYSGGELFSVAIFSEPESCCEDVCNCCDEESESIQFLVDYTFTIDNIDFTPSEFELFSVALALSIEEPELVLTGSELFDQDLPPPDKLITLSYFHSYLL